MVFRRRGKLRVSYVGKLCSSSEDEENYWGKSGILESRLYSEAAICFALGDTSPWIIHSDFCLFVYVLFL